MSAPFAGAAARSPLGNAGAAGARHARGAGRSSPRPRKHYQWYYSTRPANDDMWQRAAGAARLPARLLPPQERRLAGQPALSAGGLDRRRTGEAADLLRHGPGRDDGGDRRARTCPTPAQIAACRWLPEAELRGLQPANTGAPASRAGCNWYRVRTTGQRQRASCDSSPAGRIDVPAVFIAGAQRLGHPPDARRDRARCSGTACTRHARRAT